jgi:undecaprenyl-diphosphatase
MIDYHSGLDLAVFQAINAHGSERLDPIFLTLSAQWFGILCGAVLVAFLALRGGRRRLALMVAFAVAVALSDSFGSNVLKPLLGRMRPCFALPPGSFRWIGQAADVGSLPSLHASNFFAMAGVAWSAGRRTGLAAVVIAALVALSRVYLGVHWPTDVLAGAVWGLACAWVGLAAGGGAARLLQRSRNGISGDPGHPPGHERPEP